MNANVESMETPQGNSSLVPMAIIGALFFVFGFVTWLNGALVPFLQMVCQLTEFQALLVAGCFYIAVVVMALPMAKVLEKVGYRNGMALGLLLIAVGALLFVPAAQTKLFGIFLFAQFTMGTGLTILQTASNPYIVKIGPEESAAARIAVMGLLHKAAGVLAPMLFTVLVLGDFSSISAASLEAMSEAERLVQIDQMAAGLITPYIAMGVVLVILAVALKMSSLPELNLDEEGAHDSSESAAKGSDISLSAILSHPHLVLGAVAIFFYVGAEVIAGDTIGLYGSKLGVADATSLTSLVMAGMVVGYLLGLALIPRYIQQHVALASSAILGLVLSLAILFADPTTTYLSGLWLWFGYSDLPDILSYVALLGLANAMVWPAIFPLAVADLGKLTAKGSAILIMGISGGAILPLVYGVMSDSMNNQTAYAILFPCYAFILYYALRGYKKRSW